MKSLVVRPASFAYTYDEAACGIDLNGRAVCYRPIGVTTTEIGSGMTFASIDVGRFHTCGIDPAGDAWCWGDNRFGQLGTGEIGGTVATPQRVSSTAKFMEIKLGDQSSCALDTTGVIQCWGRPGGTDGGQVPGTCPAADECILTPTALPGERTYSSFSRNNIALVCGLTAEGDADCSNGFQSTPSPAPLSVALKSVSVGRTLGLVPTDFSIPFTYSPGSAFDYYACGVGTDASVRCWNNTTEFLIAR